MQPGKSVSATICLVARTLSSQPLASLWAPSRTSACSQSTTSSLRPRSLALCCHHQPWARRVPQRHLRARWSGRPRRCFGKCGPSSPMLAQARARQQAGLKSRRPVSALENDAKGPLHSQACGGRRGCRALFRQRQAGLAASAQGSGHLKGWRDHSSVFQSSSTPSAMPLVRCSMVRGSFARLRNGKVDDVKLFTVDKQHLGQGVPRAGEAHYLLLSIDDKGKTWYAFRPFNAFSSSV